MSYAGRAIRSIDSEGPKRTEHRPRWPQLATTPKTVWLDDLSLASWDNLTTGLLRDAVRVRAAKKQAG